MNKMNKVKFYDMLVEIFEKEIASEQAKLKKSKK